MKIGGEDEPLGDDRHVAPAAVSEWLRQFAAVEGKPERIIRDICDGRRYRFGGLLELVAPNQAADLWAM